MENPPPRYSIEPVDKIARITHFKIVSLDVILGQKAIINCRVFTDNGFDMGYNITKFLEGQEYLEWGNDDNYLIEKCRQKVQEELPNLPSLF